MAYPTSADIRAALTTLAATYPFATVMNLAPSVNGTAITALKVSKVTAGKRSKVLFTGGTHANELAPPRAVLSCIKLLLDSYAANKGISYNTFTLTDKDVKAIVEHIDIYVAPMINPDGYALALTLPPSQLAGRKNGRPTGPCARPGVNINRNCDIVWNFQKHYAPVNDVATSSDPCDDNYSGITPGPVIGAPFSEPEAANIKTLLDEGIEYFIDCHMFGPTILYSWGIEENQTTDPTMSFTNPAFDGVRNGVQVPPPVPMVDYKEYIPPAELIEVSALCTFMSIAVKKGTDVGGRAVNPYQPYKPQPGALMYPCSGATDDYAFSRHLANPMQPFVRAFTVECGNSTTTFRPTEAEFKFIEQEVHCALLALLNHVATWIAKTAVVTPPPPPPSSKSCCTTMLLIGLSHPAYDAIRHLIDVSLCETAPGRAFVAWLRRANLRTAPAIAAWFERHPVALHRARLIAAPVLTAVAHVAGLLTQVPTRPLRATALAAGLLICGGALPLCVLAAFWMGMRHG